MKVGRRALRSTVQTPVLALDGDDFSATVLRAGTASELPQILRLARRYGIPVSEDPALVKELLDSEVSPAGGERLRELFRRR